MRTSTFDLRARAAGVDLDNLIHDWRCEQPPASYDEIAIRLREHGVDVSRATVNRWVKERRLDRETWSPPPVVYAPIADDLEDGPFELPAPESAYERELRLAREAG